MSQPGLPEYIYHLSYFGIFLWFALIEQLTPIPEEISLVSLGYVSMHTPLSPVICGLVSVIGLLTADNLFFYLSLKGNKLAHKLVSKVSHQLIDRIKQNLQHNSKKTLIIMALLPKLRFLSPIISATTGISWKLFFLINSIATIFYTTVYILIGIFFYSQLEMLLHELKLFQHLIFIGVIVIIAVFLILGIRKTIKAK
jgi:membrane protein DedA with SNARE-associated domain